MEKRAWLIKKIINIKTLFIVFLLLFTSYIFFLYIKWGIVEAFKHYPSFDEGEILTLVSNFARYGKYEMQFNYYSYPKLFNPFMSIGPPFIMILATIFKFLGYHYYIVGLVIFFLVSVPLIISLVYLLNSLIIRKLDILNKIIISIFFLLFLITNRLFYVSITGGSFTHGPVGEPFSLFSIILSSLFLLSGIKKRKLSLLFISGVLSSLAFETKNMSILLFVSQTLTFITIVLYLYINKAEDVLKKFFLKSFVFLVLGFVTLTGVVWIWERSHFSAEEYRQYSCWKKIAFITNGSGWNNLVKPSLSKFENNLTISATELIHFFSDDIGDRWGINNKIFMIIFFVLMYFFISRHLWDKSKLLFKSGNKLDYISSAVVVTDLSLVATFILGSLWYFFISDFHWIRHYYIFIFIGFLLFFNILIENTDKKIFNIFFLGLLLYLLIFYLPKSPLGGSYHFREILISNTEDGEKKFISFYKPLSNKKTYVCGIFNAQQATFLSGINFFNNILEDKEDVYPKCDSVPGRRIRTDLNSPFIYIYRGNDTFYPECRIFIENNNARLKKIYEYGYVIFEYN